MLDNQYDLIVIGTGPGGAALAQRLASTDKRILILERGDYLPRSVDNWDSHKVFVEGIYQATETWDDKQGNAFHPGLHYYVGGNSKMYGAALFRLRERDFNVVHHSGGISPEWPLKYDVFKPYYKQAEALFHVHGMRGEDPTEPLATDPYPYPALAHEPRMQRLNDNFTRLGLRPFHIPIGILLDEKNGKATPTSIGFRTPYFDGYPSPLNCKA
ncbi:MAG: NAD(P)-binding protein, partial [Herbaspirillum sp.]